MGEDVKKYSRFAFRKQQKRHSFMPVACKFFLILVKHAKNFIEICFNFFQ